MIFFNRKIILIIFIGFCSINLFAQTKTTVVNKTITDTLVTDTTNTGYGNLKTIALYDVSFEMSIKNKITTYKLNGIEVDSATYFKYENGNGNVWAKFYYCTPCIIERYTADSAVDIYKKYKYVYYTDFPAGFWIEFYKSGKVKTIGHYKKYQGKLPEKGNSLDSGGIKDGSWIYYDEDGKIIRAENYADGKLIQ